MIPRLQTTRKEVISVLTVLSLLGLFLVSALQTAKRKTARISCISNIGVVNVSFRVWANDHDGVYPMQVPDKEGGARDSILAGQVWRVFQVMSNALTPRVAICPTDTRLPAGNWSKVDNTNVSYFVGLDADDTHPNMLLVGDRNISLGGNLLTGLHSLGTNSPVRWTSGMLHRGEGNVGFTDGSHAPLTSELLRRSLANTRDATNRLAFPQ